MGNRHNVLRPFGGKEIWEGVQRQGAQTIDQRHNPAKDEWVMASHAHKTVTGVPTGTCS